MTERGAARLAWALSVGAHLALFAGFWALATRNPHRLETSPALTFALLDPDETVDEPAPVPAKPTGRPPTLKPIPAAIAPTVAEFVRLHADRPPVVEPVQDLVQEIVTVGYESVAEPTNAADVQHPAVAATGPAPATAPGHDAPPKVGQRGHAGAAPVHGPLPAGKTIAYVLDCSGTMGLDGMLDRARSALLATLATQPAEVRVIVVAYSGRADPLLPGGPTEANDSFREQIAAALAKLEPAGDSRHAEGLRVALLFRPEYVLLLTDADDDELAEVRPILAGARRPVTACAARVTADAVETPRPLR